MTKQIKKYQQKLRILSKWNIKFLNDNIHYSKCEHNHTTKIAIIYPYHKHKKAPKDYILHELLHIAIHEIQNDTSKEEILIQDICKLKHSIWN